MDRSKETISASFLHKEAQYKKSFEFIGERLDYQLLRPLHANEVFLNPELCYKNPRNAMCVEVMNGWYVIIQRLRIGGLHMERRHQNYRNLRSEFLA
uniref:Uncharacterized protein n=1 Tax=Lactuca sativa TaxID=4236 RepID=A0A9R1VI86_LACSA|nr:hypothetical protein LSAT_V11C500274820 [Lactuca sativa]